MTEIIHLVEATPRNPGVGLVTVRMVSARSHARDTVKNSQSWIPALTSAPVQAIKFLGDDQMPGILEIGYGALGIRFSPDIGNDVWSAYVWEGADTTIWRGESGAAFGDFEKIFTGRCGALERQNANIGSIALRGYEGDLDRDLLSSTYAGTGGAEGDLAMKGVSKPWMSGPCEGVPGVLIDKVNWIWQLHGYGAIDDITAAYEGGLTLGSAHATVPTTYAALAALSMGGASWAKAPAVGMVRLGYEPSRPVVFDARGAKDGSTYVSKVGAIASHLLKVAGFESGDINSTSAGNLDTAFAHDWGYYTAMQASIGDVVRKALADIGGYAFPDEAGIWRFGRYKAIKTATALKGDRSAAPIVRSVSQRASLSPIGRVEVGARRCWGVHREDEISPALLDAIDAAQAAADAAQATNSVNLYRVETAGHVTSSATSPVAFAGALVEAANIYLDEAGLVVGDIVSPSIEIRNVTLGDNVRMELRFFDGPGSSDIVSTVDGDYIDSTSFTRVSIPNVTIPAGAIRTQIIIRRESGSGTIEARNGMVNRGPIPAPYSAPSRGATNANQNLFVAANVVDVTTTTSPVALVPGSAPLVSALGVPVGAPISLAAHFSAMTDPWRIEVRSRDISNTILSDTRTGPYSSSAGIRVIDGYVPHPDAYRIETIARRESGSGSITISRQMLNRGPFAADFAAPYESGADVTEAAYAAMVAAAATYSGATTYSKGKLAKDQNAVWCYINATAGSGNAPPTLPTVSNAYWELVGSQGLFTWIAYSNAADGSADFTTGDPGTRLYVGIAPNKTTSTESTNPADYQWKKWEGAPAVSVSPPSQAYNIACDSAGNPKAGEFNKVTTFVVKQGSVDLSNDADTDYSVANTNCSATMGGANGKVLTQTAMSAATAKSVVTIQRSGVTVATVDVSLTKALEGASARRVVDDTISAPSSSSYGAANGGTLEMALDTGETANVSFAATYAATSAGTFFVSARIEYREKGSPTWLLLDSEAAGSAATYLGDPGDVSIFADLVGSGGLKVYEFQLLLKRSNTGPTMNWNPVKFQVSVS